MSSDLTTRPQPWPCVKMKDEKVKVSEDEEAEVSNSKNLIHAIILALITPQNNSIDFQKNIQKQIHPDLMLRTSQLTNDCNVRDKTSQPQMIIQL